MKPEAKNTTPEKANNKENECAERTFDIWGAVNDDRKSVSFDVASPLQHFQL